MFQTNITIITLYRNSVNKSYNKVLYTGASVTLSTDLVLIQQFYTLTYIVDLIWLLCHEKYIVHDGHLSLPWSS